MPDTVGQGQISGKVVGSDGTAIVGVTVTLPYKGQTLTTTTNSQGAFSFTLKDVERGQGLNVQFAKTYFENANQAAVISLPNLKVDLGNVVMNVTGGSEVTTRRITGQIFDNFSFKPLVGANVTATDNAGQVLVVTTDVAGKFVISSNYFSLNSSFAVGAYLSNYITRTDLVAVISAEDNPIKNNPIRMYHKFGSIYGYFAESGQVDGVNKPVSIDGVNVSVTSSNNQILQCVTSTGAYPSGPYDSINGVPSILPAGAYCPDLTGIASPMSTSLPAAPARNNNSGGFKIQNDFLFLGQRYTVTGTKAHASCAARNSAVVAAAACSPNCCYRSVSTYVDVGLTGDNAVSGAVIPMQWDSWIYGQTTTGGAGVTVKLYSSTNTLLATTTTTGASGDFIFDTPLIQRGQSYKLTFEKTGYYSRLIGVPNGTRPGGCLVSGVPTSGTVFQSEVTVASIAVAGPNNAGNTTMSQLCDPSHCVKGTVKDYWSTLPVANADVRVFDGGWRTATTDNLGQFTISGNFANTAVDAYDVEVSKTGYTGATDVNKQTFKFTHNGVAVACPSAAYDLNASGSSACGATAVGPTGGVNCDKYLVLYPIGIFSNGDSFRNQIKQSYEKFLTEKAGLTISARVNDLQLTSGAGKNSDYDAFYIHLDNTPAVLPSRADTKWSNHVPVNPYSTKCTPTITSGCSPRANGVLTESIGNDNRIIPWDIKTYVYYNFYAAAPGSYTIETTGSTDTTMELIASTGASIRTDDDSGTGSNACIGAGCQVVYNLNLLRGWYYIKIYAKNNNIFGFFDVNVTGPAQSESNYSTILSPDSGSTYPGYQSIFGTATYGTTCASNNGNLVLSNYVTNDTLNSGVSSFGHMLYIAAPGENGGCNGTARLEKHGAIGEIIRGTFSGLLRPIAPSGANKTVNGFFNIIRQE
ncbi:MAG: carboxypeptidase regulatory-like domain-containing protein [Turneriella sp.]|nr:carboxypeptidase regulatory-like domain-containing protein [Turneriella sp.]